MSEFSQYLNLDLEPSVNSGRSATPVVHEDLLMNALEMIAQKDVVVTNLRELGFSVEDRTETSMQIIVYSDESARMKLATFEIGGVPFVFQRNGTRESGFRPCFICPLNQSQLLW